MLTDIVSSSIRNKLYFGANQQRQSQSRPSLTPSTVVCHSTSMTRRGTGSKHLVYHCIAVWENHYGMFSSFRSKFDIPLPRSSTHRIFSLFLRSNAIDC
jgi:hypothetical protein